MSMLKSFLLVKWIFFPGKFGMTQGFLYARYSFRSISFRLQEDLWELLKALRELYKNIILIDFRATYLVIYSKDL